MKVLVIVVVIVAVLVIIGPAAAARVVKQYEQGVLFRLGRLRGSRQPGGIITRDNVSGYAAIDQIARPPCARWSASTPSFLGREKAAVRTRPAVPVPAARQA